jgi:hypothetical protein
MPADRFPALPVLAAVGRLTVRAWVRIGIGYEAALLTPAFRLARTRLKELVRAQLGEDGRDRLIARVRRVTGPVAERLRQRFSYAPADALEVLEYGALVGAGVWLVRAALTPDEVRILYAP